MNRLHWISLAAVVVAVAFALKALVLIDATALWGDELYSVGKSFQSSPQAMVEMLREDTHPPLYYALLWCWGQVVGQTPISLRLLSWLAYLAGGAVMVAQALALADGPQRQRVLALSMVLAFCSPYPVRFAIEGKSYALLVLLVALAWWWRRAQRPVAYGVAAALAGLTHFYGLFLMLAAAAWDGSQRRWTLATAALLGSLPAIAWIGYAADYLFSSRSGSWIGRPDFALLEDTLARGLGLWPLPKLALVLVLVWGLRRWGGMAPLHWGNRRLLDGSAVGPAALMVVAVLVVSLVKPLAFSRYFVVVLPSVVPLVAVLLSMSPLNRWGRAVALVVVMVLLASWWGPGFAELDAAGGGEREQNQFRWISQRTSGQVERYSPRARLLNLSDQMEVAMGRVAPPKDAWGDRHQLRRRFETLPLPPQLWLASSGPPSAMTRKLSPMQERVQAAGYRCTDRSGGLSHVRLLQCRSGSMAPAP